MGKVPPSTGVDCIFTLGVGTGSLQRKGIENCGGISKVSRDISGRPGWAQPVRHFPQHPAGTQGQEVSTEARWREGGSLPFLSWTFMIRKEEQKL